MNEGQHKLRLTKKINMYAKYFGPSSLPLKIFIMTSYFLFLEILSDPAVANRISDTKVCLSIASQNMEAFET